MSAAGNYKGLGDYISVLRRRKLTVLVTCALVVGSALIISFVQGPVYESRARLLLGSSQSSVDQDGFGQYIDPNRIETEIQVLLGKPVRDLVAARMGSAPTVSASAVGSTAVVQVKAQSNRSRIATDTANAYAEAYIEYRRQQFLGSVTAAIQEYSRQIQQLQKRIDAIEAQPRPADAPITSSELDNLRAQQSTFQIKLQQLDAQQNLSGNAASVIAPAEPSSDPVRPMPRRDAILGLLVGLVLGIGAAFLLEHLDDSIKTDEDVELAVPGLSVVAAVPLVRGWGNRDAPRVICRTDPTSPAAEAYRALRTSVQFMRLDRPLRLIQVTSTVGGEGKTTTLANLGVVLCQAGMEVLLVDCDLRRPRIHSFFGLSNEVGFTSVILGQAPLATAVQAAPSIRGLRILASGALPSNPSDLLSSTMTTDLLAELHEIADIVLVDSPPVLPVTDAAVLATRVDGTLLVARAGMTVAKDLSRAVEVLHQFDATVLGVTLNGASGPSGYHSAYRYYRPTPEPRRRSSGRPDKAPSHDKGRKAS